MGPRRMGLRLPWTFQTWQQAPNRLLPQLWPQGLGDTESQPTWRSQYQQSGDSMPHLFVCEVCRNTASLPGHRLGRGISPLWLIPTSVTLYQEREKQHSSCKYMQRRIKKGPQHTHHLGWTKQFMVRTARDCETNYSDDLSQSCTYNISGACKPDPWYRETFNMSEVPSFSNGVGKSQRCCSSPVAELQTTREKSWTKHLLRYAPPPPPPPCAAGPRGTYLLQAAGRWVFNVR